MLESQIRQYVRWTDMLESQIRQKGVIQTDRQATDQRRRTADLCHGDRHRFSVQTDRQTDMSFRKPYVVDRGQSTNYLTNSFRKSRHPT